VTPPPLIIRRIDAALGKMRQQRMEPRAIYLTPSDYKLLARAKTTRFRRETGSRAVLWPCSHDDVPLICEALIGQMVPVRLTKGRSGSTVYSTRGVTVAVPRRPPEATKEAA
jgi:hypothetical protein